MSSPDLVSTLHRLQQALADDGLEDVPEGWLTTNQWADAWGLSRTRAGELLRAGVARGMMEMQVYRTAGGALKHYREIA